MRPTSAVPGSQPARTGSVAAERERAARHGAADRPERAVSLIQRFPTDPPVTDRAVADSPRTEP